MRNIYRSIIYAVTITSLVATLSSCTEVNPLTTTNPIDTTTTTQQKNILIEDITGVRCPNCPDGHDKAQQISDANPGRVEQVAIHTGDLSIPFAYSLYDFEIPTVGAALDNYLGPADYYPKGAVDRKHYDGTGEDGILMGREYWSGVATQRLTDTLKVNVNLSKNYNASTRELTLDVSLVYLTDITDAQKITAYITESGIVDAQEFPDHIDTFYVHNNVLRAVLTDVQGDAITETTSSGAEIARQYTYTLPTGWNAQNCRAIVFVSNFTADPNTGKEVLQVSGIDVD